MNRLNTPANDNGGRLVTLHDGQVVDSASEEWRHECEARAILAMKPLAKRQQFLRQIEQRRGRAEATRLKNTILTLWDKSKQADDISAA